MKAIEKKTASQYKFLIKKSYPKAIRSKLEYFIKDILDAPRKMY